jgi:hypothetical protein
MPMTAAPRVVLVSGHMVDVPGRTPPRFPADQVPRVTAEVEEALELWRVGPGTTIVTGGARGADIIAAEGGLARGARVLLCLALQPDEFEARSVALPGPDWAARFEDLLSAAEWRLLRDELGAQPEGDAVFAKTNEWMIDVARAQAGPDGLRMLLVWDGREGDGGGGTWDLAGRAGIDLADAGRVRIIDPRPASAGREEL